MLLLLLPTCPSPRAAVWEDGKVSCIFTVPYFALVLFPPVLLSAGSECSPSPTEERGGGPQHEVGKWAGKFLCDQGYQGGLHAFRAWWVVSAPSDPVDASVGPVEASSGLSHLQFLGEGEDIHSHWAPVAPSSLQSIWIQPQPLPTQFPSPAVCLS